MLLTHMESVRIVQVSIVGFGNNRQQPGLRLLVVLEPPLDGGVAYRADARCVREENGPFEKSRFLDPGCAGHFPVAVERKPAGEDWIGVAAPARQDSRDACPYGSFADLELSLPENESG